ncbi:DUF6241 domain-containing protein [Peribacillus deserti]|uniref:CTP synthase n=1 Tax=Peribacillus deserti TaxID=673318 RepID=A0A2N5M454_9BACI|nr:DUF6241 domain-containing protein [Peribacillus deserti]PLT29139.1 hypothetical protein CUU66_14430 [Peribacillus deserti]
MKEIVKKSAGVFCSVLILTVLSAGIYFYLTSSKQSELDGKTIRVKEESTPAGGKIIEVAEKRTEPVEKELPMKMNEYDVQEAIHGMTHQKIIAEDKWGFTPLTHERVERLITVVEKNEAKYENAEIYLNILSRWHKNDFTKVDKDHNAIWKLQDGTVGEATGIMTMEEERAFIEEHFDIEE